MLSQYPPSHASCMGSPVGLKKCAHLVQAPDGDLIGHLGTHLVKEVPVYLRKRLGSQHIIMGPDGTGERVLHAVEGAFKIAFLHGGEAQKHHGHRSLQRSHGSVVPYGEAAKEILAPSGVGGGEEAAYGVEVERLTEATGTTDEGDVVSRQPPVSYDIGLIDVEITVRAQGLEYLCADAYGACHSRPPSC